MTRKTIKGSKLLDHLDQARRAYANDRCQIDDDARMEEKEKGVWVQAWVWVPDSEVVVEFTIGPALKNLFKKEQH